MTLTEIDFFLVNKLGPWLVDMKAVVPGVSTHGTLFLSLCVPVGVVGIKNPSGRKLNFRSACSEDMGLLAGHFSLLALQHRSSPPGHPYRPLSQARWGSGGA